MNSASNRMTCQSCAITVAALAIGQPLAAQQITMQFTAPTLDRWNYQFNATPGTRDRGSTFSAGADNNFDDRDGQVLLGFDTIGTIPDGLGESRYRLISAVVHIATVNGGFSYDPTYDTFNTYLLSTDMDFIADSDAGRPIELYGVGYRGMCGLVACDEATFLENSDWGASGGTTFRLLRSAFPTDYAAGVATDVSNNVDDRFDPAPFAIGQIAGLTPGATVSFDTDYTLTIDAASPDVQAYFGRQLNLGRLRFMLSSLHPAVTQGGVFADFYMKENIFGAGLSARLDLTVEVLPPPIPGDVDGDGIVGPSDLLAMLAQWGTVCPSAPGSCPADFDHDGIIGPGDLLILLANWGRTQ